MNEPLLEIRNLTKAYQRPPVEVLHGVSLVIPAGAIFALAGESGSGKSTIARCIVRREKSDSGEIRFSGRDTATLTGAELREYRRSVQMIPQDPGASLNPEFEAWQVVAEPWTVAREGSLADRRRRAVERMAQVGLPEGCASWRPVRFSGGQRARLAIARALACEPRLLILDESLANLDLSVQAQVVNLLLDLQAGGLTYLLITHDLALAAHLADEIAVLDHGRIVGQV